MQVILTCGLFYGDEGKGRIIDELTPENQYTLIVRYCGGAQAAHHVWRGEESFLFSQMGSGSLKGTQVETYIGPNFIFSPKLIKNERGLDNIVYVDPRALVLTDLHGQVNRAEQQHTNTCGMGIGVCRKYWLEYGLDAITVRDLGDHYLFRQKYELMYQRMLNAGYLVKKENLSNYKMTANRLVDKFTIGIPQFHLYQTVLFEGSQGVLLDEHHGCGAPNFVTWSTTTLRHAYDICEEHNLSITNKIGIMRPYLTRHGDGPFEEDKNLTTKLAPLELNNKENPGQGKFKFGSFKEKLLEKSLSTPNVDIQQIAMTCCDHLGKAELKKVEDIVQKYKTITIRTFSK